MGWVTYATRPTVKRAEKPTTTLSGATANGLLYAAGFASSWTAVAVGGANLIDLLLPAALAVAVIAHIVARRPMYLHGWMFSTVLATIAVVTFHALAGSGGGESVMILRVFLTTAATAIMLTSLGSSGGAPRLRRALMWWTLGAATNAAAAIAVSFGLVSFVGVLDQPTGERLSGLTSHPNALAFTLTLSLPVVVYLIRTATKRFATLLWLAIGAVIIWGLLLSGSRTGLLIGFPILTLAIIIAIAKSKVRLLAIPILIGLGIAAYLILPGLYEGTRLAESGVEDTGRAAINFAAWSIIADSPYVGAGFGEQAGVAVPLTVFTAGGALLAIGYYIFVFWPTGTLLRTRRDPAAQMGILALLAFVGFGFFNPVFMERSTYWPILIGALIPLVAINAPGSPWNRRPARPNDRDRP